jgi:hypothetical protein
MNHVKGGMYGIILGIIIVLVLIHFGIIEGATP